MNQLLPFLHLPHINAFYLSAFNKLSSDASDAVAQLKTDVHQNMQQVEDVVNQLNDTSFYRKWALN